MSEINVTYVDHMGDDLTSVNAARVSFGKQSDALKQRDIDLIKYLADHQHYSPFEHQTLTVRIECPLYIRSQIHRHRTFAYNEISRRYSADNIEFYVPKTDDIRKQSTDNKQGSDGVFEGEEAEGIRDAMAQFCNSAKVLYDALVEQGAAKEQARSILPMCTMTHFYMTGNVRNWVHFLKLRLDGHAQKEAQEVAKQALAILMEKFPVSVAALMTSS